MTEFYIGPYVGTGPTGVSIIVPRGSAAMRSMLFICYYPVHSFFKVKGWLYAVPDIDILMEGRS